MLRGAQGDSPVAQPWGISCAFGAQVSQGPVPGPGGRGNVGLAVPSLWPSSSVSGRFQVHGEATGALEILHS